jgi:hypothetical protein
MCLEIESPLSTFKVVPATIVSTSSTESLLPESDDGGLLLPESDGGGGEGLMFDPPPPPHADNPNANTMAKDAAHCRHAPCLSNMSQFPLCIHLAPFRKRKQLRKPLPTASALMRRRERTGA